MIPETEGVTREPSLQIPVNTAKVRVESTDGYVYEVDFYAEDDWPLDALINAGVELIDVTPPGAKWAEHKSGRKFADLRISGLVRLVRLGPVGEA